MASRHKIIDKKPTANDIDALTNKCLIKKICSLRNGFFPIVSHLDVYRWYW